MRAKEVIHETLKSCCGVCQSEWHDHKLVVTVMSAECGFWNVFRLDSNLVIPGAQVQL